MTPIGKYSPYGSTDEWRRTDLLGAEQEAQRERRNRFAEPTPEPPPVSPAAPVDATAANLSFDAFMRALWDAREDR